MLTTLIERVSREVGDLPRKEFAELSRDPAWNLAGRGHKAHSLRLAKEALASNDAEKITTAALKLCEEFAAQGQKLADAGRELIDQAREMEKASQRSEWQKAGKERGAVLRAAAAEKWGPYIAKFQEHLAAGIPVSAARARVTLLMAKNGFRPDSRTIRKRLNARK